LAVAVVVVSVLTELQQVVQAELVMVVQAELAQ
jgi:hypothetical protein